MSYRFCLSVWEAAGSLPSPHHKIETAMGQIKQTSKVQTQAKTHLVPEFIVLIGYWKPTLNI